MATYDSSSIQTLAFPESIRKNPSMYLGGTDSYGLFVILRELLDNAADEYLAGRNKYLGVFVDSGAFWVQDAGSGIPQGTKSVEVQLNGKSVISKMPTMQAVFGVLHTSGKFQSEAYKVSIGCFTGDTKIRLLNGKTVSFEQLYTRWSNDQSPIDIMTYDKKAQELMPSVISHVQLTKKTRDLVKLEFDDGATVRCTPEHKFYVRRGGSIVAVQAQHLTPEDALVTDGTPDGRCVVAVTRLQLEVAAPVYDLTVDGTHTFFIEPGVLVANSHGVGVKGSNATSLYFKVWTCFKGKWYHIAFEKGRLTTQVTETQAPKSPVTGKRMTEGTLVTFKPDPSIFTAKSFPPSMLTEWAEVMSYLSPGFRIHLRSPKGEKTFLSQKGPRDYLADRLKHLNAAAEPDVFELGNELATIAVAFSNADGCEVKGFTNGLHNSQGGKHVDSVVSGLYKALRPFAGAKQTFTVHDFKDGLVGLVNAKLHKAQFSSQDKAKLSDDRMGAEFEATVLAAAEQFFKSNKAMASRLCERAAKIADLKNKFKNNKAVATALGKLKRNGLPPNYAPAHKSVLAKDRELILVEGASASGPIREVRGKHQSLLPLKGKIMNVAKTKAERALQSQDVLNILAAIGFEPKAEDPLSKLQVGRIVCLADPDPDGPLVGSTRVKMADGSVRTIKSLAVEYSKNQVPFDVWAVGPDGDLCPAKGVLPIQVGVSSSLYELTLDDGTKLHCTGNHNWPVIGAGRTRVSKRVAKIDYVAAENLRAGDSLRSVNFTGESIQGAARPTTNTVVSVHSAAGSVPVYCMHVPKYGNFLLETAAGNGVATGNSHINCLLLTLFTKYLPGMFERGMIYVADTPEFYAMSKGKVYTGSKLSEVQAKLDKAKVKADIHHVKGWGEVDSQVVKLWAVDADTRRLIKINPLSPSDMEQFGKLMGASMEVENGGE